MHKFCKANFANYLQTTRQKKFAHFCFFLITHQVFLKFCKTFCIFEMAWSRVFQKCITYHFMDKFFLQTCPIHNGWLSVMSDSQRLIEWHVRFTTVDWVTCPIYNGVMPGANSYLGRTRVMLRGKAQVCWNEMKRIKNMRKRT